MYIPPVIIVRQSELPPLPPHVYDIGFIVTTSDMWQRMKRRAGIVFRGGEQAGKTKKAWNAFLLVATIPFDALIFFMMFAWYAISAPMVMHRVGIKYLFKYTLPALFVFVLLAGLFGAPEQTQPVKPVKQHSQHLFGQQPNHVVQPR